MTILSDTTNVTILFLRHNQCHFIINFKAKIKKPSINNKVLSDD